MKTSKFLIFILAIRFSKPTIALFRFQQDNEFDSDGVMVARIIGNIHEKYFNGTNTFISLLYESEIPAANLFQQNVMTRLMSDTSNTGLTFMVSQKPTHTQRKYRIDVYVYLVDGFAAFL